MYNITLLHTGQMQATTPILLAGMLGHMHVCHAVLLRVVTEFIVPIAIVHESRDVVKACSASNKKQNYAHEELTNSR